MEHLNTQRTSQLLTSNLKTSDTFIENPKICIEEYQAEEEYSQSCGDIHQPEINGQYRYNINTGLVVVETPHMEFSQHDQPYLLHPPDVQSSEAFRGCHKNNLKHRSPHNELPRSFRFSVVNESDKSSQRDSIERCNNDFVNAKNVSMYLQLTEDANALELQTFYQQEPRHTQQSPSQKQKLSKSTLSPKDEWNKKRGRKTKHIVERNKITLGHSTSRSNFGSYVRRHTLKQERPHHVNEAVSTENQDDSSDSELRLKHGQDSVIQLTSLLGHLHWSHVQLALSTGNKQTGSEKLSYKYPGGLNEQSIQQNVMSSPGQRKLPFSDDGEKQNLSPDKDHIKQIPQSYPRTLATSLSQTLGSYPVLPPIKKPATRIESELEPGQCVNTARSIHRSSSDSYLNQLEKQKKLRDKVTNKEHSLRDYKHQTGTNLQGLDCTVTEKTNKKKRGIPFLLAKDLENDNKKVLRTKALEYAKTIAKPPLQFQPKQEQRQPMRVFTGCAPYLLDVDAFQLATLELLRKRHEEEKQAVADFRKVHHI